MRAVMVDPVERRLVLRDVPPPTPGAGQLLVRVRAAGVNRADLVDHGRHVPRDGGAGAVRRRRRAGRRGRRRRCRRRRLAASATG